MSQENLEVTRRLSAAFNRRDKAAWLAACDPEMENLPYREAPGTEPLRGSEDIWDVFVQAWDEVDFEWGELVDAGRDKVVANHRAHPRGKTSGAGVLWSFWIVITFQERRVLRWEWFVDRADALEAAGLSE